MPFPSPLRHLAVASSFMMLRAARASSREKVDFLLTTRTAAPADPSWPSKNRSHARFRFSRVPSGTACFFTRKKNVAERSAAASYHIMRVSRAHGHNLIYGSNEKSYCCILKDSIQSAVQQYVAATATANLTLQFGNEQNDATCTTL